MLSRDFAYWLQGFFELNAADVAANGISPAKTEIIRNHLNLVFQHDIDPSMGNKDHQTALNVTHGNKENTILRC